MTDPNLPRIVTWHDLMKTLAPYFAADTPAKQRAMRHDLHDLWVMGAPTPDSGPGRIEKRVLLPRHFAEWWQNMARRQGLNPDFEFYGGKVRPKDG